MRVQWSEDVVPTVAFHFRKVRRGNVTMKIWDLAGGPLCLAVPHPRLTRRKTTKVAHAVSRSTAQ